MIKVCCSILGGQNTFKVVFVRGTENKADIVTKNVNGERHDKHVLKLMKEHSRVVRVIKSILRLGPN